MSSERIEREVTTKFHNKQIALTIKHIHDNLDKKLTINDLAQKAVMSAFHFQRIFKDKTGCGVREYIRNELLAIAAEDLKNTNTKVKHIQEKSFYESPEAFTRAFKARYEITPSKYRVNFKKYEESKIVCNENYQENTPKTSRLEYGANFD